LKVPPLTNTFPYLYRACGFVNYQTSSFKLYSHRVLPPCVTVIFSSTTFLRLPVHAVGSKGKGGGYGRCTHTIAVTQSCARRGCWLWYLHAPGQVSFARWFCPR
jgi:hypothetical protein